MENKDLGGIEALLVVVISYRQLGPTNNLGRAESALCAPIIAATDGGVQARGP